MYDLPICVDLRCPDFVMRFLDLDESELAETTPEHRLVDTCLPITKNRR